MSFSMMKAVMPPRAPLCLSVMAWTMITSAKLPLVIHIFSPFSTQSSPSSSAVVWMWAASLPALGSVSAQAPISRPAIMPLRYLSF